MSIHCFTSLACLGSQVRTWSVVFLLPAILLGSAPAAAQTTARVPEPWTEGQARAVEQARERIRAVMEEKNLPGVSVAVGLEGDLVWAEGFGWADLEQRVPVTPLTRFRIGSVVKPLTSAAIGRLHEQGRLDLDLPVQEYVPEFPRKRWPITTRQLMGHVAGIRHYRNEGEALSDVHYGSVAEGLSIFAADSLLFEPGTDYHYSTYGWNVVGAVLEKASGVAYLEFMEREILAPLGMRHTVPDHVSGIVSGRVSFYERDAEGRLRNAHTVDQSNKWASGGFVSTPSDLVRFGSAMLEGELLSVETVEMLWTPQQLRSGEATDYGLGWFVRRPRGELMVGHPGRSIGGGTGFMILPDRGLVVAVTSNVTGAEVAPIVMALAQLFDAT